MLEINFTLLVQIANFAILMFLLQFLLFKPMQSFLAQRKGLVERTLADARAEEERANETLERYHQMLAEARRASDGRFAEAQAKAEEDRRRRLAEAEGRAGEALRAASADIRQAAGEARGDLRTQARALAEAIVEKVLGRTV